MKQAAPTYAVAAGIATILMWSGTPVATKIATGWMSGLSVGVLRSMLAAFVALVIVVVARLPAPTSRRHWLMLLVSGLTSFAIWPAIAGIGIEFTTASHAAIIMSTIPLFTVAIMHAIERRLPRLTWWIGACVAFAATAALVAPQAGGASFSDGASLKGDLILIGGCVICAVGYVSGGLVATHIGTMATTFRGLAIALLLLIPTFAVIGGDTNWSAVPMQGWFGIAWLTLLSSLAGYGLWFYALSNGGVSRIGSFQLALPAASVTFAVIILNEPVSARIAAIVGITVISTWWAQKHARN